MNFPSERKYKIPKHVDKAKLNLIRVKIITRKYGYLFYRKSCSNILPSTAVKYNLNRLTRNAFSKLKMNWFRERVEWKFNLRADLHYNFHLKQKCFKIWAFFQIESKTERVKETISQLMYEKNFKKRHMKIAFMQWKQFTAYRNLKKLKNAMAVQHFKYRNKNKFEMLKPYFDNWLNYVLNSRCLKRKYNDALAHYSQVLIRRTFHALLWYARFIKNKKFQKELAEQCYTHKLKQKVIDGLVWYKNYKMDKRKQFKMSETYYKFKLMQKSLILLKRNVDRNKYVRQKLNAYNEFIAYKMKKNCLEGLKQNACTKRLNREKLLSAINLYSMRWKKRCFRKLKIYFITKKHERISENQLVEKTKIILNQKKLSFYFNRWKTFLSISLLKKNKLNLATSRYHFTILQKCFRSWIVFKNRKVIEHSKLHKADQVYKQNQMKISLKLWKEFTAERKIYLAKLDEAKTYYRHNLLRETFRIIIIGGIKKKDEYLEDYLIKVKSRFRIAQKYSKLWKDKTRKSISDKRNQIVLYRIPKKTEKGISITFDHGKEGNNSQIFEWDPMCFVQPRIPQYLKKYS